MAIIAHFNSGGLKRGNIAINNRAVVSVKINSLKASTANCNIFDKSIANDHLGHPMQQTGGHLVY